MALGIDAVSALGYWTLADATVDLRRRRPAEALAERLRFGNLPDWACASEGNVHVVATTERERLRRDDVVCRLATTLPRSGSFAHTDEGIPILSPECCFLRLANELSLPELAKAGMLLVACFGTNEDGTLAGRRESIATVRSIAGYLSRAGAAKGIKQARRALRFLADNAASPPEIDACLLLCLPVMCGGYGCPVPEMNGHVRLRPSAARALGYEDCFCDLLWRDARCAVEYTSEMHHTGYGKQAKDEMRRAALEAMGYQVLLLTKPQLYNQVAFEGVARLVLRALGRRMPKRTIEHQSAQYALRKELLYEPSRIIKHACRM